MAFGKKTDKTQADAPEQKERVHVHGRLPEKRTINLAGIGEKPINIAVAIPAIILIIAAAVLLSKFAVIDRLAAMNRAQAEANAVQKELSSCYARMQDYGELSEKYAHYTYSDMTAEELNRADRVAVVNMIETVIQPRADLKTWTLSKNQVSLSITGKDLEEISQLVSLIEEQEWVSYCTVANANTTEADRDSTLSEDEDRALTVTSNITIYLKSQQEVNEA